MTSVRGMWACIYRDVRFRFQLILAPAPAKWLRIGREYNLLFLQECFESMNLWSCYMLSRLLRVRWIMIFQKTKTGANVRSKITVLPKCGKSAKENSLKEFRQKGCRHKAKSWRGTESWFSWRRKLAQNCFEDHGIAKKNPLYPVDPWV